MSTRYVTCTEAAALCPGSIMELVRQPEIKAGAPYELRYREPRAKLVARLPGYKRWHWHAAVGVWVRESVHLSAKPYRDPRVGTCTLTLLMLDDPGSPVEAQNTAERLAIAQVWVRTGLHVSKANPLPHSEPKLMRAWPSQQACDAKPDTTTKP